MRLFKPLAEQLLSPGHRVTVIAAPMDIDAKGALRGALLAMSDAVQR